MPIIQTICWSWRRKCKDFSVVHSFQYDVRLLVWVKKVFYHLTDATSCVLGQVCHL